MAGYVTNGFFKREFQTELSSFLDIIITRTCMTLRASMCFFCTILLNEFVLCVYLFNLLLEKTKAVI